MYNKMKLQSIIITSLASISLLVLASNVAQAPKKKPVPAQATTLGKDTITTASGLRYVITKRNPKGKKPEKGNKIEAHYTGTLVDGKKFDSSRDRNQTFSFTLGKGQVIAGWDEGFSYLREGETATLIIPASLGYGSSDMGDIPPNSTLIFDVELVKVIKPIPYTAYSGKGKDTVKLSSGLKYIVIKPGNPKLKVKNFNTAEVYYAGYFTNGKKFDGNFGGFDPFKLNVKQPGVIPGWVEMLSLMNSGMKVRAIIPPSLAYGPKGYGHIIPPNSTLIFDMYIDKLY